MSEPQSSHPRRRPFNRAAPPALLTSSDHGDVFANHPARPHTMKLIKGATFHAPTTSPTEECDPILYIPCLPRRAPTSSHALQEALAAGQRRVADILGKVDQNFGGDKRFPRSDNSLTRKSEFAGNDFPVPRGILDFHSANTDTMDVDTAPSRPFCDEERRLLPPVHKSRPQPSDSGIGSSVSEASLHKPAGQGSIHVLKSSEQSAITRSIAWIRNDPESSKTSLSPAGSKHIERCILVPILRKTEFKPFHVLVRSVPQRVKQNDITCLRDLEKTLLLLAPEYAVTRNSFITFCEFTIQCIHTTVNFLNDRDQRRPSDRPYTNGYFLDLVEQMNQYAAMIGSARKSRASPDARRDENTLEYSSGEELVLEGGLSTTGRQAELVRRKKGTAISLKTGELYVEPKPIMPTMKRSLSLESGDDSAMRSMARRKKNEPPMNIDKKCDHCDKRFRRPCDLTKHEKTHTRPWKCTEASCKYFKVGWPTEKERDRHVNDKHSTSPSLYKCQFSPCAYQSKRESNCKQHMEKAHGWVYHRSKNTGKGSVRGSSVSTPHQQTPSVNPSPSAVPELSPPASAAATSAYPSPFYPQFAAPETHPANGFNNDTFMADFPLFPEAPHTGLGAISPQSQPFDFDAFYMGLQSSDRNEYAPVSSATTGHEGPGSSIHGGSPLNSANPSADPGFQWDTFDSEYMAMPVHLLTPQSVNASAFGSSSGDLCMNVPNGNPKITSISPCGKGNVMLFSPPIQPTDEGFCDSFLSAPKPTQDFTLYGAQLATAPDQPNDSMDFYLQNSNAMFPPLGDDVSMHSESPPHMTPTDMTIALDEILNHNVF